MNNLLTEEQVCRWLEEDQQMMSLLRIIQSWHLPDCWLVAGTLRTFLWNRLSQKENQARDVDVIFFDPTLSYSDSEAWGASLASQYPQINWEIKNQAWMHQHNFADEEPYTSSLEAVSKYPETCTALACRLQGKKVEFVALWGLQDLANFRVRPTPQFAQSERYLQVYRQRVAKKNWATLWPALKIEG
ncbi:hypothetical protein UAS_02086 [Enterococcus asini ATCC 700915]|uniref:Nucleotidyltransferase family protein n=1 Tax=Enterococcus asini ATCC 700915 TaxID=1158606 RepID=R2SAM0_9ENTE|nr:nucleotidyltransferase family protein [Enterococcus asini]EOH85184.1 hypothetical protein UAS_02086 [Enterococcus asini ATCC 700915]EOT57450.1 hypothetical protein I579_01000 [Enterococcus asini ATCC 700915]OJG12525.1 hypothetical protein RU94_GL002073 [Enterococcus asini]